MLLGIDEGVELGITPGILDSDLLGFKDGLEFGGTDDINLGNDVCMLLGVNECVERGIALGSLNSKLLGSLMELEELLNFLIDSLMVLLMMDPQLVF